MLKGNCICHERLFRGKRERSALYRLCILFPIRLLWMLAQTSGHFSKRTKESILPEASDAACSRRRSSGHQGRQNNSQCWWRSHASRLCTCAGIVAIIGCECTVKPQPILQEPNDGDYPSINSVGIMAGFDCKEAARNDDE